MIKTKSYHSWVEYIKAASAQDYEAEQLNFDDIEKTVAGAPQYSSAFYQCLPMIYLVDYTTGKYLLASDATKQMIGYDKDEFVNGGLDLVMNKYHKDDFKLFNSRIFPDRMKLLQQIPAAEHASYIFSYTFRIKHKNGDIVTLLQRNSFIKSDEAGKPLLSFGMITNVTHFSMENPVIQLVEKTGSALFGAPSVPFHKQTYYLHEEDSLFSNREKEVLRCMAEGLTSKAIAARLYISEFTVINHRKNMMLKCGLNNVAALIHYSLQNKII